MCVYGCSSSPLVTCILYLFLPLEFQSLFVSSSLLIFWPVFRSISLFLCSSFTACFLGEEAVAQDAGWGSRTWVQLPAPARLPSLWASRLSPLQDPDRRGSLCPRHHSCCLTGLIITCLLTWSYPCCSSLPSSKRVSTLGHCSVQSRTRFLAVHLLGFLVLSCRVSVVMWGLIPSYSEAELSGWCFMACTLISHESPQLPPLQQEVC